MSAQEETEKSNLYSELKKQCNRQDYSRSHEVSNEILRRFPNETRAFHCKLVSLVHLEKYEECLRQLKANKAEKNHLQIKAYCEYRLNRIPEARQTLQGADPNDVGVKELMGQVLYRMESYEESYNWYRDLLKGVDDDYGLERQANMAAVVAMLQVTGSSKAGKQKFSEETHELRYNVSCGLVAQARYEESLKKLGDAEELCRETLGEDEDVSEEELNSELAPILIQKAYVLHSMGRLSEANEIYHLVTKQRPNDPAVLAVAANNIVCLNRDQNVFDSKKRLKVATADSLRHKMYSAQRNAIAANHALLLLHTNQNEACRRIASQLWEKQNKSARPVLIAAAQFLRDRLNTKAAELLEEHLSRMVTADAPEDELIRLQLALAQVYLQQEKVSACCSQLTQLNPNERLGVLGTMVSLYQGEQDISSASDLLRDAVQSSPKVDGGILEAAADFYLRHDLFKEAAELYEKLYRTRPNDKRVLSCLMHAYSHFDKKKAELVSRDLNLDDDDSGIDVDALETTFIYGSKHMKKALVDKTPKTPPTDGMLIKKRRHKKKKNKPPKVIDPNVPLDLERWIPRRERSYYRPRKKDKRRDNISRGPQGQTDGGANLDITASPKASAAPAGAEGQTDASKKQSRPSQPPKSSAKAKQGRKKKR